MNKKKISIVTPCFNEENSILECINSVRTIFNSELKDYYYEHIICDNSSTDNTFKILENEALKDKNLKIILNSRNFGPFKSMFNGMENAIGDAVIPFLPADLQDPPEIIIEFVKKWEEGFSVVYGTRDIRQEPMLKALVRKIYYKLIKRISNNRTPLNAGEFQLLDKKVVEVLKRYDDNEPYLRGLISDVGFKSTGISYTWKKRKNDKSKSPWSHLFSSGLNGFLSSSVFMIRLGLILGMIISFLSILYAFINVYLFFFTDLEKPSQGIMTIIISLTLIGGMQLLFISIVGEYVYKIHSIVRKEPRVVEEKKINF